jgi:hypothetical protein
MDCFISFAHSKHGPQPAGSRSRWVKVVAHIDGTTISRKKTEASCYLSKYFPKELSFKA